MKFSSSIASVVAAASVAATFSLMSPAQAQAPGQVVATAGGQVRGEIIEGVEAFRGIPFAAPPVGDLRWRAPAPAKAWTGVRSGARYGNVCPQRYGLDSPRVDNEDCLFLNVVRPVGMKAGEKRPVFVFIHGGGYSGGHGSNEDPEQFARDAGVVAVTMNYRLGTLGFLALPGLAVEGGDAASGNYGIMDQQASLRWVKANIASFGGDPDKITIAGESAGGMSVCAHLMSPGSRGLYSQAIIQSGSCTTQTKVAAETAGVRWAISMVCPDPKTMVACLRTKSAGEILDSGGAPARPVSGNSIFPNDAAKDLAEGNFARVPLLIGSNRDEGRSNQRTNLGMTKAQYEGQVRQQFGARANAVLAEYPWPSTATPATAAYLLADIATDSGSMAGIGGCPAAMTNQAFAKHNNIYWYEWSPERSGTAWYPIPGYEWGTGHATELPYMFPKRNGGANAALFSAAEKQLARDLVQYWGGFVKTGQPGGSGLAAWPAYSQGQKIMSLHTAGKSALISQDDFMKEHKCAFWTSFQNSSAD